MPAASTNSVISACFLNSELRREFLQIITPIGLSKFDIKTINNPLPPSSSIIRINGMEWNAFTRLDDIAIKIWGKCEIRTTQKPQFLKYDAL